jgi:alanine-synthesizing transaminase
VNFSHRTNWHHQPNLLTKLLDSRRSAGKSILDLTVSNPTEAGILYPELEILSALAHPSSLHYQPEPGGLLSARQAIVQYYREKNISVDPSYIILTASTSEAYSMLFKLLCNSGDSVVAPRPSYPLFDYLAQLNDVSLQHYRLVYDSAWRIDIDSLRASLTPSTRAIVIINPHNPTGMFLKKDELAQIIEIARERNLTLIVDEVFMEYGFTDEPTRANSAAGTKEVLTFTLNGISKLLGLPQMKLGWFVASGSGATLQEAMARLEIIADTFLSVNIPAQVALPKLLNICEPVRSLILNRIRTNYHFLEDALKSSSCSVLSADSGWYGVLRIPRIKNDEAWALELLNHCGVYVFPGYFFDFEEEGCLVVSLLVEERIFQDGVMEIVRYIGEQSGRRQ